ncbi:glycosyltransferase family 4 protein [Cellulosimicrobium arenosum]|uniref:D-inositol 3-phosphate glycosyltransferase n=1 Tax=Cellulosimicrobium arenosum TaxID=2708133 RepID=A0A927IZY8_9MICO|nr:glycosyltransferase family 4 protein [Cellulosimicrobium arenosum]MBD8078938.1 glycosyltransferase family 4 protein [Cellulosimicrobium arenosum]
MTTAVALVTSSFLPRAGGVEEHVRHVAHALRDAGHRVAVWSVDQGDEEVPHDLDGIPVRYLPTPMPARNVGSVVDLVRHAPGALGAWRAAYRADRPDVLHVHCYGPQGVWAHGLSALTRTPLVVTGHGETFMDAHDAFDTSALLRAALRRSLAEASAVTACSGYALTDLERRFDLTPGAGTVVPNGIDLDEAGGARPSWLPDRYLLAVGRVVRTKGFDLLLEAFARADLPEDVRLVLGGDGPELEPLRQQVDRAGLADRVVLPGRLSRPEIVTTVAAAQALVVPSRVEAFGIVVLEGWRAGVPVVVTSRGGPPEFVDEARTGLLVDPEDAGALAHALERVVHDRPLADRLGSQGRAEAGRYSWDRVAAAYAALYPARG